MGGAGRLQSADIMRPPRRIWTRRLDAIFLHPVAGPLIFMLVVIARVPDDLLRRPAADGRASSGDRLRRAMVGAMLPDSGLRVAADRGRLERRRLGGRVPAADPAAVPVHRHSGRLRLSGARGADRRPHHGQLRPAGQDRSSRCFRLTPARCRPSWRRAPSRTSATASPPF